VSIAVVGESLVDLVWHPGAGAPDARAGGSPANVAVGLRRLGRSVTLVTCWGDDPPGDLVRCHLADTGVDVDRAPSRSGRTTVALASIDARTLAATYDFLPAWDPVALPIPEDAVLLHTGSLAVVVEPGAEQVLGACTQFRQRPGAVVAVDLNIRPTVQPDRPRYRAAIEALVAVADVVKASDDDLAWLWPDRTAEHAARALLDRGARLVALTCGGQGATGYTNGHTVAVPAPQVEVVDTIGAGDAFQAALLHGLLETGSPDHARFPADKAELDRLLRRAVRAGSLATTRPGAQPPTLDELEG